MSYNSGKPPCKYWQQGNCRNGNRCKFAHTGPSGGGGGGQQQGGFGNNNQTQNRFGAFNGNQGGGNNNWNNNSGGNTFSQGGNTNWNNNRPQGNNNYNNNRNQGGGNNWNNNRNNNNQGGGGGYNNRNNNQGGGNNNWNNNRGHGNNNQQSQKDYPATILEDLSVTLWPFSCYGPDTEFPNLISGDFSFEEMRWEALKEFKAKGNLMQYNQTVAGMFNEAQQKKQQAIQARQSYVPPVQQQQQGGDVFGGSGHGGHAPQPAITGGIFAGIDSAPQQSSGGTTSIFGQTQGFGAQTPSVFGGAAQTPSIFGGGQQQQTGSIFGTPLGAPQPASGPTPFGLGAQSPQQSAFGVAPQAGLGMLPQPSFQLNPSGAQGPSPFGQSLLSGQTNLFQTAPQTPPQQGLAPTMLGGLGAPTPSPAPTLGDVAAGAMVSADSLAHFRADRFTFGAIPEDEPPVEVR